MDVLQSPSKSDAIRINRCRIFLQATTISDITSADGTRITEFAWTPQQKQSVTNPRRSKHSWPRQPRQGPKSWKAWKGALQCHLSRNGRGQKLRQPLGPWKVSPSESRQHWEWYIDYTTSQIIHNTAEQITAYPLVGQGRQQQHDTTQPNKITEIPTTAQPTDVHLNYSTRNRPNQLTSTATAIPTTFTEYIAQLAPWDKQLIQDNQALNYRDLTDIINTEARIIIVSDGGMKE